MTFATGVTISTHKARKADNALAGQDANTRKKFAFLSRETTPDYRPLPGLREEIQVKKEINVVKETI